MKHERPVISAEIFWVKSPNSKNYSTIVIESRMNAGELNINKHKVEIIFC